MCHGSFPTVLETIWRIMWNAYKCHTARLKPSDLDADCKDDLSKCFSQAISWKWSPPFLSPSCCSPLQHHKPLASVADMWHSSGNPEITSFSVFKSSQERGKFSTGVCQKPLKLHLWYVSNAKYLHSLADFGILVKYLWRNSKGSVWIWPHYIMLHQKP